jgi:uncharacterized protein YllA (UPF0747 family)
MVNADEKRAINSIDSIEKRMLKAEKDKHENSINQINSVLEKLFPNGSLQERFSNFFEFYLKYDSEFLESLYKELKPLDFRFTVISED